MPEKTSTHRMYHWLLFVLLVLAGCRSAPAAPAATATPDATPTPAMQATPLSAPAAGLPHPSEGDTGTAGLPWWNDRVFYEVFVRSFQDNDGDGIGDLQGLIDRLDYLNDGDPNSDHDLGVTGLWLMPVAESPSYHGYDVVDYYTIAQDYGTAEDFQRLMAAAHERGMVVVVDLVLNHTSTQHPWFLASAAGDAQYRDWYVWVEEPAFCCGPWGQSVWHRRGDPYYFGLFWEGMPDLNLENPEVTEALFEITRFWLQDMGVDGFRLDAVKHLIEDGRRQENTPATHEWLQGFYREVKQAKPYALTVGEAWTATDEAARYVGDEVDVVFEFDLAQGMVDSANRGARGPAAIAQGIANRYYPHGQYAAFLTNHDQNRVMSQLGGDVAKAKQAATLLLTNPGVPFIYYGEEIGMQGEKPDERIRTPMQWDASATAGFTTGRPWQPLAQRHEQATVAAQTGDPDSLLSHYRRLIRLRQQHDALRAGVLTPVRSEPSSIYAYLRHTPDETLLVLLNLGAESLQNYSLSLAEGPLVGALGASMVWGEGDPAPPTLNAGGGFNAYRPLPELAPRSSYILRLAP